MSQPASPSSTTSNLESSAWLVYRFARKVVVTVIGVTLVLIGVVMFVTPGPAFVVIPAGLAVLATEYVWAQRWLERARQQAMKAVRAVRGDQPPSGVESGHGQADPIGPLPPAPTSP